MTFWVIVFANNSDFEQQIVMVSPGSPKLKMLSLYVTRQLIWKQMSKLFIIQFTEIKI